jgi:hypothetical protein
VAQRPLRGTKQSLSMEAYKVLFSSARLPRRTRHKALAAPRNDVLFMHIFWKAIIKLTVTARNEAVSLLKHSVMVS